jgi:secretion/DNA translocation related TadE-like protein
VRPAERDDGFVAIAVAGLALVLVAVGLLVAALGAVAVARHRAAAAADLAALAAAQHVVEGSAAACGAAERVAAAQGARVASCRLTGPEVEVVATVRPAGRLSLLGTARARARAGPRARMAPGTNWR